MYKIIGADQKEYGPVSSEQLRQWIAEGRVNAQTKVQAGGGEWKFLSEVPELADALSRRAGTPPRSSQPQAPAYVMAPAPAKTSAMAVTSLVLGILGLFTCGLTALPGVIFGLLSMSRIKKSDGQLSGWGLGLAGTIVSGVFLLMLPVVLATSLLPAFVKAKDRAQTIICLNNERQLFMASQFYANQHNGRLPPAATWCDDIKEHVMTERAFHCPRGNPTDRCSYAFNEKLGGLELSKVPGDTVMFFEADAGWNASGGRELIVSPPRHRARAGRVYVVVLVDGSVQQVEDSRLATLRWEP